MADLTQNLAIAPDWTKITALLNMADGKKYRIDSTGHSGDTVYFAETDTDADALTVTGHLVLRGKGRPQGPALVYKKRGGVFGWMRRRLAAATLTVSETN